MSKFVYAIEGLDRLGKSTLIEGILQKLGYFQVMAEPVSTWVQDILEFTPLHIPRFVTKL